MTSAQRPWGRSSTRATTARANISVRCFRSRGGTTSPGDIPHSAFPIPHLPSRTALELPVPHIRPQLPHSQGLLRYHVLLDQRQDFIDLLRSRAGVERTPEMGVELARRIE